MCVCVVQFYLRTWSQELKTPVVSIDYSLSPEAPFPRPVEECTMAYAWILQNLTLLGVCVCVCVFCIGGEPVFRQDYI